MLACATSNGKPPCQIGMPFFTEVNVPWKIMSAMSRHRPENEYANRDVEKIRLAARRRLESKRRAMTRKSIRIAKVGNIRQFRKVHRPKYIEYASRSAAPIALRNTRPARV